MVGARSTNQEIYGSARHLGPWPGSAPVHACRAHGAEHHSLLSSHESVRLGPLRVAIRSHGDLREKQCHKAPMTGNGFNMFQSHQFMVMTGWLWNSFTNIRCYGKWMGNQGATKRGIQRHTFLSPERLGMPPWCPHMCWFNLRMPTWNHGAGEVSRKGHQ